MTTSPMLWTPDAKALELRTYQVRTIEELREALRRGYRRIILCAPTGAGKTEMGIYLIQEAQAKRRRVTFVVDSIPLVKQTSERFADYGIPHGYVQGRNTRGRRERIQVAMAQTIEKREYWNDLDLLVIDECHIQRKAVLEFAKQWGGAVIGLSATPLTKGLNETYQTIVNATTTDALLAEGWLAPLRIYAATEIDMKGAKRQGGEWTAGEVRNRGGRIIGDIVSEWVRMTLQHFGGPVKTLVFSADVAHGEDICRAFQREGYDFRQSTYHDDEQTTDRLVEGFKEGKFTGLVSVAKFVKGFDVKDVLCGVDARPNSSSLAEVIQKMGRVMRSAPGKEYGLWLDHAGNMAGWYEDVCEIWANGVAKLPDPAKAKQKRKEGSERQDVTCIGCSFVLPRGATACPYCGKPRMRPKTGAVTVPGRMGEVLARPGSSAWQRDQHWTWQQICRIAADRKGGDEDLAKRFALAQYKTLYREWPRWSFDPADGEPDPRVAKKIKQQLIAWAKGDAKRKKMGV